MHPLRDFWEALTIHLRDSVRHVLALILMAGTLAGTVFTFSNGQLTLDRATETLVSVGGIGLALELAVIFGAFMLGVLDERIARARKASIADTYKRRRLQVLVGFVGIAAISALANFIFRVQQLDNAPLAGFVALAPIAIVYYLMIILRPLPTDYDEMARQASSRAVVTMIQGSELTMRKLMRQLGRGVALDEAQARIFALVIGLIGARAPADEQHAMQHALSAAQPAGMTALESGAEVWLTYHDLMSLYGYPKRTAQSKIARVPGARKTGERGQWEAPRTAVIQAYGLPRSVPAIAPDGADTAPHGETYAPVYASTAPVDVAASPSVTQQGATLV